MCLARGWAPRVYRPGQTRWRLGVARILVEAPGVSTGGLTVLPCPRVRSGPALPRLAGRRAVQPQPPGISAPSRASMMLSAPLTRFPGAPPITGSLDQRVSTWTFQNIPQGVVLASGPHRHPLMGVTHAATLYSCLASSGILYSFFQLRWP